MNKRDFLKKTLASFGSIVALPVLAGTGSSVNNGDESIACEVSPRETRGPFPIKSPAELLRANIVSDRQGVALLINLQVQAQGDTCTPLSGAQVDIWHCDAEGHYSEYGGVRLQEKDYTKVSFLRGRQTTDENGQVSFISIFPGWYPGRAPHLHVDVLKNDEILLSTQIAFPEESTAAVYASRGYQGKEDTPNERDGVFRNSLAGNMADSVTGNVQDGYTLSKVITVG
ncbi:intradiol ring-cleavage dioxygenase [Algoriphagus aestuariicola]|uniref:Intradiol ring-cleavage dioxygenase n=1 Tax=Algoriphagus aestuariicola TaxID=1852016 RepID=A0ABS3BJQ7_9BACT|nr:intradiol ring-cleavage dioxygenase [Algoriphagus aestuariicola]MBN7799533.1 intradiol ring-cleavage dioxygenase [Algoriphagus aestuariicola]